MARRVIAVSSFRSRGCSGSSVASNKIVALGGSLVGVLIAVYFSVGHSWVPDSAVVSVLCFRSRSRSSGDSGGALAGVFIGLSGMVITSGVLVVARDNNDCCRVCTVRVNTLICSHRSLSCADWAMPTSFVASMSGAFGRSVRRRVFVGVVCEFTGGGKSKVEFRIK